MFDLSKTDIGILAILGVFFVNKVLPHFWKKKEKELEGKVDKKELDTIERHKKETADAKDRELRGWVELTCGKMIKSALDRVEEMIDKVEKSSEKRYKELAALFEEYKKYNHDRANRIVEEQGMNQILIKALDKSDEAMKRAERILNIKI